jgi:hypothetical protein
MQIFTQYSLLQSGKCPKIGGAIAAPSGTPRRYGRDAPELDAVRRRPRVMSDT